MENIALEGMEWSVGRFGDCRLDKGGCAAGTYGCARHGMHAPAGRWVPRATRPLWPVSRQSERDGCGAAGRLGRTDRSCGDSRHVLAIQDTSEVHFRTTEGRRRGLGEVGHGNIHGLLVHAMLALDAATGSCLGLVGGRVWTRSGPVQVTHNRRALADKEFGTLAHHRRACQGSAGRGDDGDGDCRSRERPLCRPSTSSGGRWCPRQAFIF